MKLAFGLLLALFSLNAYADRTEATLDKLRRAGLREVSADDLSGVRVRLYLTAGTEKLIADKAFDVEDKDFDEAKFRAFVIARFSESLAYFRKIVPNEVFNELHVVVEDLGESRSGTISQTTVMSRVIHCDFRRWHKLYKGYRAFLADLTSIHEYTHSNNYFLDGDESKKHRELVAVVFESLNLIRQYGAETYVKNYLKKVTGPVRAPEHVLGDQYHGMQALRHTAHSFMSKVLTGRYPVHGEPDAKTRVAALERFAAAYLGEPENGAAGFDRAALAAGLLIEGGAPLTLDRAQEDLFRELAPDKPLPPRPAPRPVTPPGRRGD